jgi:hypothetical protein
MKIAIVGAGFFGHHIAAELAVRYPSSTVDIFEMAQAPLLGAGTINQCRLHLGFHYPRSGYTIYQSVINYDRFLETYGEFLNPVDNNLYAVHRDGLSTAEQYLAVMDSFSLPYERMEVPKDLFVRPEEISLLLRVPEKSIDVRLVRTRLSERFSGTLHLGITIDEIDPTAGRLFSGTGQYGPFDFVINATYVDPNLGLPESKRFGLKHELTALVLAKTSLPATTAVTIMDGSFVSLYPAYGGLHTLSSVAHTPFRKYPNVAELLADYPRREALAVQERVSERIGQHVQEHLGLTYSVKEVWVTAKTKLATDKGDSRVTEVRRHDRLFSVLCGKIDAVFGASDTILREMN